MLTSRTPEGENRHFKTDKHWSP